MVYSIINRLVVSDCRQARPTMLLTVAAAIGVLLCVHPGTTPSEVGERYGSALLSAAEVPYTGAIDVALAAYYAVEYPLTPASVAHRCAREKLLEWVDAQPPRTLSAPDTVPVLPALPVNAAVSVPVTEHTPVPPVEEDPRVPPQPLGCVEILGDDGLRMAPRRERCTTPDAASVLGCAHGRVHRGAVAACVPPHGATGTWHT